MGSTSLDAKVMREHTASRLTEFMSAMKAIANVGDFKDASTVGAIDDLFSEFDSHLNFCLRQFDIGFHIPKNAEAAPTMSNSINVGTMTGSVIQQDSPNAKQTADIKIDLDKTRAAVKAFEAAIEAARLADPRLSDIAADLDTIKAQLAKGTPSSVILREAGQSVRTVVEGIVGNALTNPVLQSAIALGAALGLR